VSSDREATLAEAYDRARPRLVRVAYATLGSHAEAEDIVSDCWSRLLAADQRDPVLDVDAWATVTITKSGTSALSNAVSYATANGSAVAGTDYTAVSNTLTFAPADTTKTFTANPQQQVRDLLSEHEASTRATEIGTAGKPSAGARAVTAAIRQVLCQRISAAPLSCTRVMNSSTGCAARIGKVISPRSGTSARTVRCTHASAGQQSGSGPRVSTFSTPSMSSSQTGGAGSVDIRRP